MKKLKQTLATTICLIIGIVVTNNQAQSQEKKSPVELEASYISEILSNFSGGIKTGSTYMGLIDLSATIQTQNIGLWENGSFYLQLQNTHGGTPSSDYIGDMQVVSNIENGDFTYLYQLWYKQQFGKVTLQAGILDLNADFFVSDFSGEYINSSFGIMPVASLNAPVAIFPKPALAFMLKWDISESYVFQAGVFDGDPLSLDEDPYNTDFSISAEEGYFSVGELHYNYHNENDKNGVYKIGVFYHSAEFEDIADTTVSYSGNSGIYFMADQILYANSSNEKSLGAFLQAGISSDKKSLNDFFWAAGFNYYGVFNRPDNILGMGITNASISNKLINSNADFYDNYEATIEVFFKTQLTENIGLQPEFQYVINPSGDATLDNAFVGLLRAYLSF